MGEVDDYLTALDPDDRAVLERVAEIVAHIAPDAEQGRSYGMPAWRWKDRPLVAVAATKLHLSLFPFSPAVVEAVAPQLDGFSLSKGTIRFSAAAPLPDDVVAQVVRLRLAELDG